ncbi:MAG: glycoside hydrolase family 140 protein [Clostridia bacterium]|nr:glycoside hydrolase family 140 protein [Clostridia bacterium]
MKKLLVHPNRRYLMDEDGNPFFYLADTAWELFHKLTREDAEYYIGTRAKQGFNVIQAVALAEHDGLRTPNPYGRVPFHSIDGVFDPEKPDLGGKYDYWQHVDFIIETAEKNGIYIALLPTWGDKFNQKWGEGPEIFTKENAYNYGTWIAKRYCNCKNIIWVLGGDRPIETDGQREIIDAMGRAIKKNAPDHLITYHPPGESSSTDYVTGKEYIDFHSTQTGHGLGAYECHRLLAATRQAEQKPFLDMESRYEDHPACFNENYDFYWDAADVRQNAYWAVMEGACGHTYGNHCIWSMNTSISKYFPYTWKSALLHEGAGQMQNLKKLRLSRPYFEFRAAPELIGDDKTVIARQSAGRGDKYAFVYTPFGNNVKVYLDKLGNNPIKASWFDPRTGKTSVIGIMPPKEALFTPSMSGKEYDMVLVLDLME